MAFTGPASVGLMPTLVAEEHLQSANSLRVTSGNVASIVGPPVAGILVATSSPGWALAADALSYVRQRGADAAAAPLAGGAEAGAERVGRRPRTAGGVHLASLGRG